ncbi:hypothetical protein VSH64_20600 [Amycolatopsis rhabdoformis]|uniref:Uncharacterized protein n=1 Tax=Amycolatopsis rhabdoformis TaxID=1448059 RepID=A0ABZ1IJ35_9PSEU|nr:hypothetical protein [Amycolatopsis rhabdoformis]WSE34454.1 hypothetical protein VSH64_20600 [Amycolatopsis rhabdoformis]
MSDDGSSSGEVARTDGRPAKYTKKDALNDGAMAMSMAKAGAAFTPAGGPVSALALEISPWPKFEFAEGVLQAGSNRLPLRQHRRDDAAPSASDQDDPELSRISASRCSLRTD